MKEHGCRILPPISVPTPMNDPLNETRADSPPDEPPVVSSLFRGFKVRPNTLLTDSPIMRVAGIFVFTNGTAPAFIRRSTSVEFEVAGL